MAAPDQGTPRFPAGSYNADGLSIFWIFSPPAVSRGNAMHRLLIAVVLTLSFVPNARPQVIPQSEKPALKTGAATSRTPGKEPAVGSLRDNHVPGEVEVVFLNGSTMPMVLRSEAIEVQTPYGKLSVPLKDIRAIEFGLHLPDDISTGIASAIKDLEAPDYASRDRAAKALLKLGPHSYSAVYRAAHTGDLESSRRAEEILKQLKAKHPKKDLKISATDRIITPTFTIAGRILTVSLQGQSELFRQADFPIAKMRSLRAVSGPSDEIEVNIDAGKYAAPGQWLETGFEIDKRSLLVISAEGLLETDPQNGQLSCGPNGIRADPNFGDGSAATLLLGDRRVKGPIGGPRYGGMLLGRIGEDGDPFMIGERYQGIAESDGKLYLHIGPSTFGRAASGSYDVKIMRRN
jgi:hypothetical protein